MFQSIRAQSPANKANTKSGSAPKRSYSMPSDYYSVSIDEEDEDFMSPLLEDIDFNELAVEESKDFKYDNDEYEEDTEEDEEEDEDY